MEEMELILDEGEGYLIEFKESMSDSLAKEMVAFANSSGGRIFLGVSDDGTVKGVNITNRLRSQGSGHRTQMRPAGKHRPRGAGKCPYHRGSRGNRQTILLQGRFLHPHGSKQPENEAGRDHRLL